MELNVVKNVLMVFRVPWVLWEVKGADSREITIHSANIPTKMLHICTEDLPCESPVWRACVGFS